MCRHRVGWRTSSEVSFALASDDDTGISEHDNKKNGFTRSLSKVKKVGFDALVVEPIFSQAHERSIFFHQQNELRPTVGVG